MTRYPGQDRRRSSLWVVAVIAVVLGAFAAGWSLAPSSSQPNQASGPCPAEKASRDHAAACLVAAYFAVENEPAGQRNSALAQLVEPGGLLGAQDAYAALRSNVTAEYAAVAATNVVPSQTRPDTDATGQAWVAFVDAYRDGSPPLAQWWITSFGLHWSAGRWWLTGSVTPETNATPQSAGTAPRNGFGPGWVAVGRA